MGMVKDRIAQTLGDSFNPSFLEVVDESDRHKGHGGWREGGETHFRVRIESPSFAGMSRLAIHRAINEALASELADRVHALAIEARAGAPDKVS